ncbi:MAG: hypothetical protein GY811_19690 [Myxococcales bacterium]|nr:hypothetical protein [Myxococcales bacterium]
MHKAIALSFLYLSQTACGGQTDDGSTSDAEVFALGTDGVTSGILSQIFIDNLGVGQGVIAGVAASDSVVRHVGDRLYIVNRFGSDNVTIVDIDTKQLVAQISTGAGTNPQDVAVIGDSIYVCAYDSGNIIVLDQGDEQATPTLIDISSYDSDGVPNCGSIIEVDGNLYASLGILDDTFASQGGKVIVIDSATNTISTDFDLTNNNPFGLFEASSSTGPFQGDLLITTTEDFGTGNGCVERVSPGPTPASAGCLIENSELGGFVSKLQVVGDSAYLAVSTSFTEGKLVRVDSSGTLAEQSITPAGQHVTDFVVCPWGEIVTNDKNQGTLRVYGSDDVERTESAGLDIGLPAAYANGIICL